MFPFDSTLYPLLGVSAYLYNIVAISYLGSAHAPINPDNIVGLATVFVLYYTVQYITFYAAFSGVAMADVLRSHQKWFNYNVCHMMGVVDALNASGRMGCVAITRERNRSHWMEWVSIRICALVRFMILYRLIAVIVEGGCEAWNTVGAVFFGAYVFFNMCPTASISLNERLS